MKYPLSVPLLVVTSCVMGSALAAPPPTQAANNRKQLTDCMTKQMSASRTISYNEATKVCKDLIKSQNGSIVASNEAKPRLAH